METKFTIVQAFARTITIQQTEKTYLVREDERKQYGQKPKEKEGSSLY
jgi:hypothetical protein